MRKFIMLCLVLCMTLPCAVLADANESITILFTNDVHCGINDGLGYAGLAAYKRKLEATGSNVLLVDAGDSTQGKAIGTLTQGSCLIDIMNKVGYDVATPGNHEFDYTVDGFQSMRERAEFPYVSANFVDLRTGKLVLDAYVIKEVADTKIAFIGISTPQSIMISASSNFTDENGEFVYDFMQDETGEGVYTAVQNAVDAARAEGADYVIALAHLGIGVDCSPWTCPEVINNTAGIDAFIDGHSHSVLATYVNNKDGQPVLHMQTGKNLANIGALTIVEGKIEGSLISAYTGRDPEIEAYLAELTNELDKLLKTAIAHTDVDLVTCDPQLKNNKSDLIRLINISETNLGNFCADAYKAVSGADISFINGDSICADLPMGDITYEQIIALHPYNNMLTVVEATGQQILDCLEWGVHDLPDEFGGFMHAAGLTYEIHTYIESSAQCDDTGMFTGVGGEYRVKNVMVNGEALDLEKIYSIVSCDYILKNHGDGFTMFKDNKVLRDDFILDNQALMTYISDNLGGVVDEGYRDIYGQGRMTFVNERP